MPTVSLVGSVRERTPVWSLCLLLLFISLASKLINSLVLFQGIAIIYRTTATAFVAATVIITLLRGKLNFPYDWASIGIYILTVISILSIFWTLSTEQTLRSLPDILLNAAFFFAAVTVVSHIGIEKIVEYLYYFNIVLFFFTIVFLVVFGSLRDPVLRATPLVFGLYATLLLPISFAGAIVANNRVDTLIGIVFFVSNLGVIVLSAVRTALLMIGFYTAVFVLCWWLSNGEVHRRLDRVGRIIAAAAPIAGVIAFTTSGGSILIRRSEEFMSRVISMDFTTMPRYQMLQVSTDAIRDYPLLGIGLQSSPVLWNKTAPIHNYIVDGAVSFGLVGLISALVVIGCGIKTATRLAIHGGNSVQNRVYSVAWAVSTLSVLLIWAMLQGNIANSTEIYAVVGISLGLTNSIGE